MRFFVTLLLTLTLTLAWQGAAFADNQQPSGDKTAEADQAKDPATGKKKDGKNDEECE